MTSNFLALTPGISDSEFIRGDVPMTKEEIRILSVCRLGLSKNSVLYDIGSGTGSVAVEAARLLEKGQVIALEKEEKACLLIEKNRNHFEIPDVRLKIVKTSAPDGFEDLPCPTHAFIGGSGGRLFEIISALKKKNPSVRVVMNAVTLESVAEIQKILKETGAKNVQTSQISVSRSEKAGSFHILKAQNPVFIFSFDFEKPSGEKS